MVKAIAKHITKVANKDIRFHCHSCDLKFVGEEELKDQLLSTVHSCPSQGTRNFKYRITEKTARANIVKGARKKHFQVEHKKGATNIDFNDGSWILVAFPVIKDREKNEGASIDINSIQVQIIDARPGYDSGKNNVDFKVVFSFSGSKIVVHAYNSKQKLTFLARIM